MSATNSTLLTRKAPSGATEVLHKPFVIHVRHALARFGERLGNQFAAAVTYFLVLALIPTLMFAFATLGFVLSVVRPELVDQVVGYVQQAAPGQDQLVEMLQNYLRNWASVGIVAVVGALYTAQGFIGNLKDAVRSQLVPTMDDFPKESFGARIVNNVVTLVGLLIGIALTLGATVVGTGLISAVVGWFNLPGWASFVINVLSVLVTLGMSWLLFMFIFTMIPSEPIPKRSKMTGSLAGALALTILLNLATVLVSAFSNSPTAALFGPVIAIMLSMNVFTRIILMVAAWMGTAQEGPVFRHLSTNTARTSQEPEPRATLGGSLGAIVSAIALIALTLMGLKKFEDKQQPRRPRFF